MYSRAVRSIIEAEVEVEIESTIAFINSISLGQDGKALSGQIMIIIGAAKRSIFRRFSVLADLRVDR